MGIWRVGWWVVLWLVGGTLLSVSEGWATDDEGRAVYPPPAIIAVVPPDARGEPVTLKVADEDVQNVVRALFKGSGLNYVFAGDIHYRLSLNLDGVPREKALRMVLQPYGLTFTRENGVYLIRRADPQPAAIPEAAPAIAVQAAPQPNPPQAAAFANVPYPNAPFSGPGIPWAGPYGITPAAPWPISGYGFAANPALVPGFPTIGPQFPVGPAIVYPGATLVPVMPGITFIVPNAGVTTYMMP